MTVLSAGEASDISGLDLINLFAASLSIVLAIVALALSVFFFRQSKSDAERSTTSANEIASSVARLEKIFDSLYADTFAIMRETVTDMRQHVWKALPSSVHPNREGEVVDAGAERRLEAEQARLTEEIAQVSSRLGVADATLSDLKEQVAPILSRGLADSQISADEANDAAMRRDLESRIRRMLLSRHRRGSDSTLRDIVRFVRADESTVVGVLFNLASLGVVDWSGAPNELSSSDVIRYVPVDERASSGESADPDTSAK